MRMKVISCVMAGLLILCQTVPAGASFADEGEPLAHTAGLAHAMGSSALTAAALGNDDTFVAEVEGVSLVFQVIDSDALTVRLGTGEGRGNGLANAAYPDDHKVVVPEVVAHDGLEYTVKEIAASALRVQGSSLEDTLANYVGDVTICADLDWVGEYAFSGGGTSGSDGSLAQHTPFAWRLAGNGAIRKIAITAFYSCGMDELVLPEGADIDSRDGQDNLRGPTITKVVYPLSYSGTVYCNLSRLKSLYVKSPYSKIDAGNENDTSVSVSAQAKYYNDGKKVPYYAWAKTQASDAIMNGYCTQDYATFRAMAAFSDWSCPEWAVPEGSAAYTCKANVVLGIEDGAVYPFAPTPSAKCVDDDGPWTLALGTDFTVEYYDATGAALATPPTRPGTYGVRFVGNDKSAWGSTDVVSYTIGADLSDASVEYDADAISLAYSGAAQSPAVTVEHGGAKLTSGLQYMERYIDASGNTSATAPTLPGSYVKRVASRTPWAGLDVRIPFEIRAVQVASVEAPAVALSGGSAEPRIVVRDADGAEIAEGAYTATVTRNGVAVTGALTQAGTYAVEVEGDGKGCTGSASCEFNVVVADRALASAEQAGELAFTGEPLAPAFKVVDAGGAEVPASSYTVALADADGNAVAELVDAGEYTAEIMATDGWYAGAVTCTVTVDACAIAVADVQVAVNRGSYDYIKSLDWAKLDGYDEGVQPRDKARVYLSAPIEPAPGDFSVTVGGEKLVAGRDFDVTLDDRVRSDEDSKDHETAFTVTLKGNYSGAVRSADLPGAPKVTINKRIAHTVWHKGVLFSYAVDTDGKAVVTGLGIDLSTSTQASDLAAAYQAAVWGRKVTVPDAIADGDATYQVKAVCPNAFSIPRDGGNGSVVNIAVLNGAKELEVEAGVETIGASAFSCSTSTTEGIEVLTLHEGLRTIEPYGLSGASVNTAEIVIPASVERIGYAAFGQNMNNSKLEKFEFAEGSKFCGGSVEGIAETNDDISGGVVRLTGTRRYGGIIVDGGGRGSGTKETSELTSLTVPAQYTSSETLFTDFIYCTDVRWMADYIEDAAAASLNSIGINLSKKSEHGEVTVWGWDNEGTNLPDAVDSNADLHRFRPFAVLGDGYEYAHATGGPKTYPGNVAVGTPSVSTVAGEQAVDWDFQLSFANRKYRWTPVEGEDFTVSYVDPQGNPCDSLGEAGVYTATLTGNGVTCFGTATAKVEVGTELPADAEVAFADGTPAGFTYDGTAHEPAVESVTLPGAYAPLDPESEYSVRYEDNVDAGTMRVVVEGRGGYFGSLVREFEIAPASLEGAAVALSWASREFTGSVQKPSVSKVAGKALGSGDYTAAYSNSSSKDAGSYTVTVAGRGNYAGTAKAATYKIAPASLSGKAVALAWTSRAYTGGVQKPSVSKVAGKALKLNADFTAKYSNASSKTAGSYTVTVSGRGNYTGTAKAATYKIAQAANSAKVKWTSKTYKLKANKKTKKLAKAATVALPSVTKKFGTAAWKVTAKDKKKALSLSGGKVKVKKGAKAGTYTVKLVAKVAATKNYKAAQTKTVTVRVRVV